MDMRLFIERQVVTKNADYGSEVVTWAPFATVWGQALDVMQRKEESTIAGVRMLVKPCQVVIRYLPGVTTDMRITVLDRNRQLKIFSLAEVNRRRYWQMMCEEFSV